MPSKNATPKGSPSEAQGRTLRAHPGYAMQMNGLNPNGVIVMDGARVAPIR
jgi:hypothetical protein